MVFIEKVLFRLNVALFPILNSVHSPNLPVSFSFPSNSLIYIHLSLSFIFPTHWKPKSHVPSCVAGVAVALRGYCQTIFRGVFCPESGQQTTPGPHFYSNPPCIIRQYRGGTATWPLCKQLTALIMRFGYRSEFIRCECCVMFAETLSLLISLYFNVLLGLLQCAVPLSLTNIIMKAFSVKSPSYLLVQFVGPYKFCFQ